MRERISMFIAELILQLGEKSSRKNRLKGQIKTLIASACGIAFYLNLVENVYGQALLIVAGILFGADAFLHAAKIWRK